MPKHEMYLDLAKTVSEYSTCNKLRVGCLLVHDHRILSMGYNGAPRGAAHCEDAGCYLVHVDGRISCKRSIHAEANALINAAYVGASTKGATLYSTHSPCFECAKLLINAGVREVIFMTLYSDGLSEIKTLWQEDGLKFQHVRLRNQDLTECHTMLPAEELVK